MYQYGNPYMSYQQPVYQAQQMQPSMPNFSYAQRPVQQGLAGRAVSSPDEVTVQEVPTDGSMGLFPAMDGSCIWGKRWTPDGKISTVRYVPEQSVQTDQPNEDPFSEINEKVDRVISILTGIKEGE